MSKATETPGTELDETLNGGAGNGEGGEGGAPVAATEFEIDGAKYSVDDLKAALKAAGDYEQLLPEFTRKSQSLAEASKKLEQLEQITKKPGEETVTNPAIEQAKKVLREQIGVITAEDLKPILDVVQAIQAQRENQVLESVSDTLSKKYDGSHGEPKFDVTKIAEAVKGDPSKAVYVQVGDQYLVDLEQTYKRVNGGFWDKVPEFKQPQVVRTERGAGTRTAPLPEGQGKAATDEEKVASAIAFFREAAPAGGGE